jgi:hypothetical protein
LVDTKEVTKSKFDDTKEVTKSKFDDTKEVTKSKFDDTKVALNTINITNQSKLRMS